jgi:predicted ATPase
LPDTPERQQQELEFSSALGVSLGAAKGMGVPETGRAFARARELWERLGSPSGFHHVLYGQARYHSIHGELDLAQRLNEDLLRLSHQHNDLAGLVLGYMVSGRNQMSAGKFVQSRSHLEEALALYDPISLGPLVHHLGVDPQVHCQTYLVIVLFCLGYPDQALALSNAAIAAARKSDYAPSLAQSLALGTTVLELVGENAALKERAGLLAAVGTEQDFPFYRAAGTIFCGWAKMKSGEMAEGMSLIRAGSAAFRATGSEAWMPYFLSLLARACEIADQFEEALTLLDDALQIGDRTGERWFAAETNRQKGQLLLRQGSSEAAEELYYKALSIAHEQEAKLWELRAAASLARLRRDQGRHTEARDLLAPVYGWFTEGFDTPDLKEARALLAELT